MRFIIRPFFLVALFGIAASVAAEPYAHYLKRVYPLLPKHSDTQSFISSLDFYYAPFPKQLNISKANKQFYCLAWMYACNNKADGSIYRNLYQPNPNAFKYAMGLPSNSYVEVMHYKWYNEPSLYFYKAKGSGVFLDLGKTLPSRNKVEALKKLGLSDRDVLSYATSDMYADVKSFSEKHHMPFDKALSHVIKSVIDNSNYHFNRIAGGAAFDIILTKLCRQKHYDTFQFTVQPNDNGQWGYEIMDCRTPMAMPLKQRWQYMKKYLSVRDPLNLHRARPCHYKLPFKAYLQCEH